jgi:hypothetical protein
MPMDWIIYVVLFILVILLGTYYKKLQQQKIFLEHFDDKYRNNSVLKSYDTYNQSYTNLVEKNNVLQSNIVNNKYGSYYDTIYSNFFRLNKDSEKLVPEINRRAGILERNINNFKQDVAKDVGFVDTNKNRIIDKYNKQTDKTFSNLNKPNISIKNTVDNLYKKHLIPSVGNYAASLSNNKEAIDGINKKYNAGLQQTTNILNGQQISFLQSMESDVKQALDNKKKTLPSQDLSNNPGILVRIYSSSTPIKDINTFGKLTNEYVVPAINYYMTSTMDSFFNNKKISFEKLDKTNCVYGRIPQPGASGNGYKYLGDFDTYEQCTQSANIDSNAKAITIHDNNSGGYSKQCYSINDNNTRVTNQNYATCGIISSLGVHRYLEFLGNISIPKDASIIEFKLESAVGSRLYFAGALIIDDFQPNKSVDRNSSVIYVVGGQKVPFKLQALEGLDNTNSYIILKWRINQSGSYNTIPVEYYFLPNLKPNFK